jgi:homoserine kinase
MTKGISVFAPATVANVGCAFDVLGFALQSPGDTVTITPSDTPGFTITAIEGDNDRLPRDPATNAATVAAQALLTASHEHPQRRLSYEGFAFSIKKGLPIGSGLGSSSASSAAAVVAMNHLLGSPYSREELVRFAMEGERVACGSAHADNVAPAILGGFVLIRSYDPLEVIKLPVPYVWVTIANPHLELKTSDARRILRRSIPLSQAISQWGNVAALVAGIYTNDPHLMGRALQDHIIEPERAQLIPGYQEAKQSALDAGALGCSISGAGPSLFAFSATEQIATNVADAMSHAFQALSIESTTSVSQINKQGASLLD